MATKKQTREQWLEQAIKFLKPLFTRAKYRMPKSLRVSVGFPLGQRKAIGQAWAATCSADDTHEHFISPAIADPLKVLAVLVHEIAHTVVGAEHGHKAPFRRCALLVGLEGKMTATHAGEDLLVELAGISKKLGKYPHARLTPGEQIKKQTTRLRKMQCLDCGLIIRTTDKWIDLYAVPWPCPCGGERGLICPDEDD